jgi:myo-inositol-1-phosphate synthase
MGAVSTSFVAGVHAVRRGLGRPFGSLTQMGQMRDADGTAVPFSEMVPLAGLDDLVFGGWDLLPDDAYAAARKARVLERDLLEELRPELETIRPWKGIFDPRFVRRIEPTHCHAPMPHMKSVETVERDIARFRRSTGAERIVLLFSASTEAHSELCEIHDDRAAFEKALRANDPRISPGMIYAYAALRQGIPVLNGTPSHVADFPALEEMGSAEGVPIAGRDLKTGQTLMKTILAPGLKMRALGIAGWYSTNILGNRDGKVLDDPECFLSKQESKLSVLTGILEPDLNPEMYGDLVHNVRIDYYPPRGDNKEAWDNIDVFGWLGYPMQIKINFLCRDSILAAPLVLDLALLGDLAQRAGESGFIEWLSIFFKSPTVHEGPPVHDLFQQYGMLETAVREIAARFAVETVERRHSAV